MSIYQLVAIGIGVILFIVASTILLDKFTAAIILALSIRRAKKELKTRSQEEITGSLDEKIASYSSDFEDVQGKASRLKASAVAGGMSGLGDEVMRLEEYKRVVIMVAQQNEQKDKGST